jgi:hypothetical protein
MVRVEEEAKQQPSMKHAESRLCLQQIFLLDLFFNTEYGGHIFIRNVD